MEGRFNGGAWTPLTSYSESGLTFSGTLPSQAQGQGTLEIRCTAHPSEYNTVSDIGIGDVFIIAGQSNAVGQGTSNQAYSGSLKATLFANSYTYENCLDPTDSSVDQVDTVSLDPFPTGSVWPLIATEIMADQNVPVMFIPCAKGGTAISQWQPGVNHQDRSTLYGSMIYRALQQSNGVKAVLWWQGESDALAGQSPAYYSAQLAALATSIIGVS